MSRDPRVRPKSALNESTAAARSKQNSRTESNHMRSSFDSRKSPRTRAKEFQVPGGSGREIIDTKSSHPHSDVTKFNTYGQEPSTGSVSFSQDTTKANVKMNSWLGPESKQVKRDANKEVGVGSDLKETSHATNSELNRGQTDRRGLDTRGPTQESGPRNSFSSFLEAQYEEDYSVLALSADLRKSGNHGFFLETNSWTSRKPEKGDLLPKFQTNRADRPRSREDMLRESLEQVVKENAKLSGNSEPDKEHVENRVSAMFEKLDTANLEAILGKDRYERLIKNFEESEEIVDGVSSATGTGWLKESNDDSQLDRITAQSVHQDNVMDTLTTHRSDSAANSDGTRNIQIEISEPYSYRRSSKEQNISADMKTTALGHKVQPHESRQHSKIGVMNLTETSRDDIESLPVVPSASDDFQREEKDTSYRSVEENASASRVQLSTQTSQPEHRRRTDQMSRRKNETDAKYSSSPTKMRRKTVGFCNEATRRSQEKKQKPVEMQADAVQQSRDSVADKENGHVSETNDMDEDSQEDALNKSLKDYDKRLTKSSVFNSGDNTQEDTGKKRTSSSGSARLKTQSFTMQFGGNKLDSSANRELPLSKGLLEKAFLETDTHPTQFRANFVSYDEEVDEQRHISHLTREDHVEGIKQHVELR